MRRYRAPGLYFEQADLINPTSAPHRTDIAGFVGVAERGPFNVPVRVNSFEQFRARFGKHIPDGLLAYAVEGFFANGGQTCYVVRAGDPGRATRATATLRNAYGQPVLKLTARDYGEVGNTLKAVITPRTSERFNLAIEVDNVELERWEGLSIEPANPTTRSATGVLNGEADPTPDLRAEESYPPSRGSRLVEAELLNPLSSKGKPADGRFSFTGGRGSLLDHLRLAHLTGRGAPPGVLWGLQTLDRVPEVALVAMPDLQWYDAGEPPEFRRRKPRCHRIGVTEPPSFRPAPENRTALTKEDIERGQNELIAHCIKHGDRFALLDASVTASPDVAIELSSRIRFEDAALYYPWLAMTDPLELEGPVRFVPPSGHMAGLYARVEREQGIQKPPANEPLDAVKGVAGEFDRAIRGLLNESQVNLIRAMSPRGVRPFGAGTLAPRDEPESRYVNVRRVILFVKRAVYRATQWLVFEPNTDQAIEDLGRVVSELLDSLWREGALDGGTASEAYSVRVDEAVNPPEQVALGRLECEVRLRIAPPAEIVIVRIGLTREEVTAA